MYLKLFYYETPKLVNAGDRSSDKEKLEFQNKDEQFITPFRKSFYGSHPRSRRH